MIDAEQKFLGHKHKAYRFIVEMKNALNFKVLVLHTAMTLYHRFYMYQSMATEKKMGFNWLDMAR